MNDFNGFANLMEVQGRDFQMLQTRLMEIPVPAQIHTIGTKPTGAYYAILKLDRPNQKRRGPKPKQKDEEKLVGG